MTNGPKEKIKVLFLDVDGVLNSYRNVAAYGRFPWPNEPQESELDPIALQMIRRICRDLDVKIVLSSTWREHVNPVQWGEKWDLPIIDSTSINFAKARAIAEWIRNPESKYEVTEYVIIDDDWMRDDGHQVYTTIVGGMLLIHYIVLRMLLGDADIASQYAVGPQDVRAVFKGDMTPLFPGYNFGKEQPSGDFQTESDNSF